jgi:glycosyltransferase involved in cell wall biosynthesis
MRVSMIGPFGFTPKKTMRARAFRIARELVQRGHDVAMFMPPWHTPDSAEKTWTESGVIIRYVALNGGAPAITRRLVAEALAWQPDVVHCFKPKAYSGAAATWLWLRQRKNVRIVMDMDDWEGWGGWNDLEAYPQAAKHIFAKQEQWGMKQCHALTVASRALETLALGHGISAEKVIYLPNGPGIDIPPSNHPTIQPTNQPTLLLYTRFFEFNVSRLVTVLKGVHAQAPDVRVLVVGASLQEADSTQFQREMEVCGLLEIVEDVGWVEEERLPEVLGSADIGLYLMDDTLLNRTKCPVKLADMCALGLPVVGESVGQVSEYIVQGRSGFLRPTGDVDGIVADILRLLGDDALRGELGAAAQAHIQARYAWDKVVDSAEKAYFP